MTARKESLFLVDAPQHLASLWSIIPSSKLTHELSKYMFCFQFTLRDTPRSFTVQGQTFLAAFLAFLTLLLWALTCLYLPKVLFWIKLHWPMFSGRELEGLDCPCNEVDTKFSREQNSPHVLSGLTSLVTYFILSFLFTFSTLISQCQILYMKNEIISLS